MLFTALLSYIAGLLTVLAPCILPLLPVILGGSIGTDKKDKKRPYIIIASLIVSLVLFTILLKASTVLIGVDPKVWVYFSGVIVILLGLFMLFPDVWARVIGKLGIEHRSQSMLGKANNKENRVLSAILIGAALGPVFSSCSPTYAWVLATVLPSNAVLGMFYLTVYVLGVATSLLAIALLGRRLLEKVKWASNPKGWFQRGIAVLFILVGLFIVTGWDKRVQTWFVDKDFLNLIELEQRLVPGDDESSNSSTPTVAGEPSFNVDAYQAPELRDLAAWINTDPLTIESLKGKVVLVDFWTYSCINCIRTQPFLNAWQDKYANDGLVIIGVHAPEFAFEKVEKNVAKAVRDAKITYPVALDNNFSTWQAYKNRFWPAKYLIDKDGKVRYTHFGEGDYDVTESTIQALLEEAGNKISRSIEKPSTKTPPRSSQSPETYLGYSRGERFSNASMLIEDKSVNYVLSSILSSNEWSLGGNWQVNDESSQSNADGSQLAFQYSAKEVYLVMSGPPGAKVKVEVEGIDKPGGSDLDGNNHISLDGARLYKLVNTDKSITKRLTLTFPTGVTINAFTFGS